METKSRSEKTSKDYTTKSPSASQNEDSKLNVKSETAMAEPLSKAELIYTAVSAALTGLGDSKSHWVLPPISNKGDCNQITID